MTRLFTLGASAALVFVLLPVRAADSEAQEARMEALRELNDFIGEWKGTGEPDKARPAAGDLWSESITWAWRFKGDDAWLNIRPPHLKLTAGQKAALFDTFDASGIILAKAA